MYYFSFPFSWFSSFRIQTPNFTCSKFPDLMMVILMIVYFPIINEEQFQVVSVNCLLWFVCCFNLLKFFMVCFYVTYLKWLPVDLLCYLVPVYSDSPSNTICSTPEHTLVTWIGPCMIGKREKHVNIMQKLPWFLVDFLCTLIFDH